MFIALDIQDIVRVPPTSRTHSLALQVHEILMSSYVNRLIPNGGICLFIERILSLSDQQLIQNDCCTYITVVFTAIVFQPYIGELLTAQLVGQHAFSGLALSTGFCDTIIIPPGNLPSGFHWEADEGNFQCSLEDGVLAFDLGCEIKFRVTDVLFNSKTSTAAADILTETDGVDLTGAWPRIVSQSSQFIVVGSCDESGLGDVRWWRVPPSTCK